MNVSRRDSYILVAVVIIGVLGAYWLMALSPKRQDAAKLDKDIMAAEQQLEQAKQEKVTFAKAQLDFPRMYASLGRMGKAVPPDEDMPSLLVQLNHAAAQANVDFRSLELKLDLAAAAAPTPTPTPPAGGSATPPAGATGSQGPTTGATGATGATGSTATASAPVATSPAPAEFEKMPFEYKFEGSFYNLEKLIANLNELVERRNQELAIAGRLITIEGFSLRRGKVTVRATTYMLPADQGLFLGATPQAPANADPAAPQAASAGTTTPAPPTAAVTTP